jgi:hypothetical protein
MDKKNTDFAQIPNLVDDWGLLPATFRLYAHIKRVAGDKGKCWEGQDRLAEICKLTTKTVIRAKRELQDKGLISINKQSHKGHIRDIISIVNIWPYVKKDVSEVRDILRSKSATDNTGLKKIPRSNSATEAGVKEVPLEGENSHCINNHRRITKEEKPSFPAGAGPKLFNNSLMVRLRQGLKPYGLKIEDIEHLEFEINCIRLMLSKGFSLDQIFSTWESEIKAYPGKYISMDDIDDRIGQDQEPKFPASSLISRMQAQLDYPEKVKIDPIRDPAREAYHIEQMLTRGFTGDQIFELWLWESTNRHGQYVSMFWVNRHIGQKPGYQEPFHYLTRMQTELAAIGITMTTTKPMREVKFIKHMLYRYTEDEIFQNWLSEVKECGKFISMYYISKRMH